MAARIYRFILSLYPPAFRSEFDNEMQAVFNQIALDVKRKGIYLLFVYYQREFLGLVVNLINQHRESVTRKELTMADMSSQQYNQTVAPTTGEGQPGSWGAAFLGGLPHLLMGLLIGIGKLLSTTTYQLSGTISFIVGISLALLVATMLTYAWRRGWPLWSASWYGYGLWVFMAIAAYGISELNLHESWRYTNILFLGWLALWGIGYLYLFFHDQLRALLAIFFFIPLLGVMMLEFIPNAIEGWLAIALGVLTALTAATIIRLGSYRITLGLVIGVNLVAVFTLAYIGEYQIKDLPPNIPAHTPKLSNFFELLAFYTFLALILMGTPFLIQSLVNFGRRKLLS
jgi:hypothetical protein